MLSNSLFSQQKRIPDEVKYQIDNYKANAFKNRNNGNDNAAAMYMNKIGFIGGFALMFLLISIRKLDLLLVSYKNRRLDH